MADLVVQAPRRGSHTLGGYLLPGVFVVALIVALVTALNSGRPSNALVNALIAFVIVWFYLYVIVWLVLWFYRQRHDDGAGVPLAELTDDGVSVRWRAPRASERRTGRPAPGRPTYDVRVPWSQVTGWYEGKEPYGRPVIVLTLTDPGAAERLTHTRSLGAYLSRMEKRHGSTVAIRAQDAGPEQEQVVRDFLARRGLPRVTGK